MFEWSKCIMEKVENSGCFDERELRSVEIALRLYDMYDRALDESLGLEEKSLLELRHRISERI